MKSKLSVLFIVLAIALVTVSPAYAGRLFTANLFQGGYQFGMMDQADLVA